MNKTRIKFKESFGIFRSRLSLRIVFWVFVSITLIEAILLVPSVEKRKQEVLLQIADISSGKISWILATYPNATGRELLAHTQRLYGDPMLQMILGGAIYDANGNLVGQFGEPPAMPFAQAKQGESLYRKTPDGDRYDVAWTASQPNGEYSIILHHNAAFMQAELFAYILRIVGLVLIISAFVTLVMMISLSYLVITPILTLRRDLARAGESIQMDQLTPNFSSTNIKRKDELGDVITAFQHMFAQICQSILERKQAEEQLLQNNYQMQQYIQEASQITTAAAEVEKGQFYPERLEKVALRDDELGQLARVFQRMVSEIKQREDRLKQQVADLKIEIDQTKRERDVAQVVHSNYFKELQQEVEQLNSDEFWA